MILFLLLLYGSFIQMIYMTIGVLKILQLLVFPCLHTISNVIRFYISLFLIISP